MALSQHEASAGSAEPKSGRVDFGELRRIAPFSDNGGFNRGQPIDRYYIETFLEKHRTDVRGRVLEIRDAAYTQRFGNSITESHVLDICANNAHATLVADLAASPDLAPNYFDCIIVTQTLQYIFDVRAAIHTLHRILKQDGVLFLTVPGISPCFNIPEDGTFYWWFSPAAVQRLLEQHFAPTEILVEGYGNLVTSIAFLSGLAQEDLVLEADLQHRDKLFPMIVCARARK